MLKTSTKAEQGAAQQVEVILPAALVTLFPGSTSHLSLEASSVSEMLDVLDARWPGMRDRLRDSRPSIRKHINIFVNGRRATLDTALEPGATVYVLTAMSGG